MSAKRQSMHGEWSSRWMFIFAATSAAVGLGNIWKFPYIAGENGGGAFVLVYLLCVAFLGIPILCAEIMIGRRGRKNPADSIKYLAQESHKTKQWYWIGLITILAGFLILSYYTVVAGWALDYVYQASAGHFNEANAEKIAALFTDLITNPSRLIFWNTLIILPTIIVIAAGVKQGLERTVR